MIFLSVPAIIAYLMGVGLTCMVISERRSLAAILVPMAMFLLSIAIDSGAFLMFLGLVLVALVAVATKLKWYTFGGLAIAMLACTSMMHSQSLHPAVVEVDRLRTEFPVRSLKDRLAFHQQHPVPGGEEASATYLAKKSDHFEGWRTYALKRLHEESYRNFVTSIGFGVSRMPRVTRKSLELPVLVRMPVASKDICFDNREIPDRPKPVVPDLVGMHRKGLEEFLNRERMGYARGVDYVIGFEPHAMAAAPGVIPVDHETWQVARLELVSLLKHDEPVVYVSDNLPNLEELDDVPTRPLDGFEQAHLPKLKDGEYLLTGGDTNVIRMLGAVRASESCLACHSVPMGTLLGAFSYELRPVQAHSENTTADRSPDAEAPSLRR